MQLGPIHTAMKCENRGLRSASVYSSLEAYNHDTCPCTPGREFKCRDTYGRSTVLVTKELERKAEKPSKSNDRPESVLAGRQE